jgi:hypothetical protein
MRTYLSGKITLSLLILLLAVSGIWIVTSPAFTEAEKGNEEKVTSPDKNNSSVIIDLANGTVTLQKEGVSVATMDIVSQGKPGSYYETMGGSFESDYKEPTHFSSFGHVYMPWSVHVFGNYFIHGIPYYEDGTRVSSSYSGGCVRLNDADAKKVYDFITKGTTILITRSQEENFSNTKEDKKIMSQEMTTLMVATISLEALKQDEVVSYQNKERSRLSLLPIMVHEKDTSIATLYAHAIGEKTFLELMNKRAATLGLSNTTFTSVTDPATTSYEDYIRFVEYIQKYKSYLLSLENTPVTQ